MSDAVFICLVLILDFMAINQYFGDAHGTLGSPCKTNANCEDRLTCKNSTCTNICTDNLCGSNGKCEISNHLPVCRCNPGFVFTGTGCQPEGQGSVGSPCQQNANCEDRLTCQDGICKNVCTDNICGTNGKCEIIKHVPVCRCKPGYVFTGKGCQSDGRGAVGPPCQINANCEDKLICQDGICRNVCTDNLCGSNGQCEIIKHLPVCRCKPGYVFTGTSCQPDGQGTVGSPCQINANCEDRLTCQDSICKNICTDNICGINGKCEIIKHVPVCRCKPGYVFTGTGCQPDGRGAVGPPCQTNANCEDRLTCQDGICKNVCTDNLCGSNGQCEIIKHVPVCRCKPGYIFTETGCQPDSQGRPGSPCQTNANCEDRLACQDGICKNICTENICGSNGQCEMTKHMPVCRCNPGYVFTGTGCQPDRHGTDGSPCQINDNCEVGLTCQDGICRNLCADNVCGVNAICEVNNHVPTCRCKPGYVFFGTGCQPDGHRTIGSPCEANSNCENGLTCDNGICKNMCAEMICGINAICEINNHVPTCRCKPGFVYIGTGCQPGRGGTVGSPCQINANCEDRLTCQNSICTNTCTYNLCGINAQCVIVKHIPTCRCNPGYVYSGTSCQPDGQGAIGFPCQTHANCQDILTCRGGVCSIICTADTCGINTLCMPKNHWPICYCKPGYIYTGTSCQPGN